MEGWEPQDTCIRGGSAFKHEPACCGGNGNPFVVYNQLVKQCCTDGKVALHGMCPGDDDYEDETTTEEPIVVTTPLPPIYGKK